MKRIIKMNHDVEAVETINSLGVQVISIQKINLENGDRTFLSYEIHEEGEHIEFNLENMFKYYPKGKK